MCRAALTTILTVVLAAILALGVFYSVNLERFTSLDVNGLEQSLYTMYNDVLKRAPTAMELRSDIRKLVAGSTTLELIKQRQIDSDEYRRLMKAQNNELVPELPKMLSDARLIGTIAKIYRDELGIDIPPKRTLPLKDIFVMMAYNQDAFRKFLRHDQYKNFMEELGLIENLNRDVMITVYKRYFGATALDADVLAADGYNTTTDSTIASATPTLDNVPSILPVPDPFILSDQIDNGQTTNANTTAAATAAATAGQCINNMTTTDMQRMIDYIMNAAQKTFDKDRAASSHEKEKTVQSPTERIYLHSDGMVLRPEFAWSVPQWRAPVCTSAGQKQLIQPLLNNSRLLLGTPLGDAKDTEVGSIMPKFEFKQFVDGPAHPKH